ncbi:MAG TPA: hypothetical protein VE818_12430 [Nitrososphaeraceae archaeon]|nr:hypothetical protein [Nitrososphaeraceae archaeon]
MAFDVSTLITRQVTFRFLLSMDDAMPLITFFMSRMLSVLFRRFETQYKGYLKGIGMLLKIGFKRL